MGNNEQEGSAQDKISEQIKNEIQEYKKAHPKSYPGDFFGNLEEYLPGGSIRISFDDPDRKKSLTDELKQFFEDIDQAQGELNSKKIASGMTQEEITQEEHELIQSKNTLLNQVIAEEMAGATEETITKLEKELYDTYIKLYGPLYVQLRGKYSQEKLTT